jgi:hypothetical protein
VKSEKITENCRLSHRFQLLKAAKAVFRSLSAGICRLAGRQPEQSAGRFAWCSKRFSQPGDLFESRSNAAGRPRFCIVQLINLPYCCINKSGPGVSGRAKSPGIINNKHILKISSGPGSATAGNLRFPWPAQEGRRAGERWRPDGRLKRTAILWDEKSGIDFEIKGAGIPAVSVR